MWSESTLAYVIGPEIRAKKKIIFIFLGNPHLIRSFVERMERRERE